MLKRISIRSAIRRASLATTILTAAVWGTIISATTLTAILAAAILTTNVEKIRADEKNPNPSSSKLNGENQPSSSSGSVSPNESVPLVERPETLKQLDSRQPIWVSSDRSQVVLLGTVCLREGLLELFACRTRSKEHESIVAIDVEPYLIHAALLVIGAKQGSPAKFDPVFVPPSGEKIEVRLFWKDRNGDVQTARAQEMIREVKSQEPMKSDWVFTGGLIGQNSNGQKYYLADISGEIVGVSNFPGSVLDVPFESSANNEELYYEPNTEKIPEIGTEITVVLSKKADVESSKTPQSEKVSP